MTAPVFNPRPRIEAIPITDGKACYVIDDALLDPGALVALAVAERARFAEASYNAYPGLELRMSAGFSESLDRFFSMHLRERFGARRVQRMYSRLSMVTLAPPQLAPSQWLCHRDRLQFAPGQCVAASVLYLFRDTALGGTSFFAPRRPGPETEQLLLDARSLDADRFIDRYGLQPGYLNDSNPYFEKLLTVAPKWNRLIFYDGDLFHSGHIPAAEKLRDDPCFGRLTLNGFFTCSRSLAVRAGTG